MPACLWELSQWQRRVFPPRLSVSMPPLSLSLSFVFFLMAEGEEVKYVSLFLSQCFFNSSAFAPNRL